MRFVYEVHSNEKKVEGAFQKSNTFYYADEGAALQAARRSAEEYTCTHAGPYKVDNYKVTLWSDDVFIISDMAGHSIVHVHRHPVL
jgi:hypothetical protein